jgi:hypothetical protein
MTQEYPDTDDNKYNAPNGPITMSMVPATRYSYVALGLGFDCNNCPFAGLGLDIKGAIKQPSLLLNSR